MGKKNSNSHARLKVLNKHQRAASRPGEKRVGREEIHELLQLSAEQGSGGSLAGSVFFVPLPRAQAHRRGLGRALPYTRR